MQKRKILIVEDENIVALDLNRRLVKLGYEVVGTASSSVKAIKCIEKQMPDLVLMDIRIQGKTDGIETAELIDRTYQIPVIFLTAHSEEPTLKRALSSMPYGYLLKPCSEKELHANIQVAIEKSRVDRKIKQRQHHLQMAMGAGNLAEVEIGPESDSPILTYAANGQLADVMEWDTLIENVITGDRNRVLRSINYLKEAPNRQGEVDFKLTDTDGRIRHLAMFVQSHDSPEGVRIIGALQDVTERQAIAANLEDVALGFNAKADGIAMLDESLHVISANSAYLDLVGEQSERVIGNTALFLDPSKINGALYAEISSTLDKSDHWAGAVDAFQGNREPIHTWMNISKVPMKPPQAPRHVLMVTDISRLFEMREKLSNLALYDGLTHLPNRNLFLDRLDVALARAKRENTPLALIFLDLDHFKRINDSMGHQMGDLMLRAVALRLKEVLRVTDTLCRIGGDEFIMIIESAFSRDALRGIAESLLSALDKPMLLGAAEIIPSASIGISVHPVHSDDRDDLIKMADTAMYSAKNSGRRRYAFYDPEMTLTTQHYLHREMELRSALQNDQFELFYQPQYDAKSRQISGLEALIRWRHPQMGLLAANEIIPVAEMSDLIVSIGNWVVEEACRQHRAWLDEGLSVPRVAFNVSPRQLMDSHFSDILAAAVDHYQIGAGNLEIEITESCLQDNDRVIQTLKEVTKLGVTVSIDDFGTGYSCLSSLKALPIHRLKIDQSFVRDLPDDESDGAIARAVIALAQQLKLRVTAEGVETEDQAAFVSNAGCEEVQGFLFNKPMDADKISSLLSGQTD